MPIDTNHCPPAPGVRRDGATALTPAESGALDTPVGRILVTWRASDQAPVITGVRLAAEGLSAPDAPDWIEDAFGSYFSNPARGIALRWSVAGTEHQRAVWNRISAIPSGGTRTYGDLGEALGSSARAVGNACRANPVPLLVPCHRVVARSGLGGFAGDTSGRLRDIKGWLLHHERGAAGR